VIQIAKLTKGQDASKQLGPLDTRLLALLTVAKFLIHVLVSNRYGYFRDELYFLDCARHLDWGYVDHAPLVAIYAKISLWLGGSLPALRVLAAIAGSATVALAMLITERLGGKRFAQGLAGLCVIAAPIYLGMDGILTMNAFEPLFWMGCIYVLISIVLTANSRLWIWFGLLAGLGIENKHSTLIFGFAVAIALLASPQRRELLKPWIWLGGSIAILLFLPNLIWQIQHGFPTLEDLKNVRSAGKNIVLNPLEFLGQQIILLHPLLFPVWLAGLISLIAGKLKRMRVLGWIYVALLLTMLILNAKNYYLAPIYPMLFAAGAVVIENWLARRAFTMNKLWPKTALASFTGLIAAITIPAMVPVLSPAKLLAYQGFLGITPPKTEVQHNGPLPQNFGDQFGWEQLVKEIADIYRALPPEERKRTGIFASNYGEAGAINLFGPTYGLPPAICAQQTHYFWGPPDFDGDTFIWLQWDRADLEPLFQSVEKAGEHFHPWGMAEENQPIYLCRGLRVPLIQLWPRLKHWN
jgi:hypothetical protein